MCNGKLTGLISRGLTIDPTLNGVVLYTNVSMHIDFIIEFMSERNCPLDENLFSLSDRKRNPTIEKPCPTTTSEIPWEWTWSGSQNSPTRKTPPFFPNECEINRASSSLIIAILSLYLIN